MDYFRGVAQQYGLYKNIKLNHKVVGAWWDDVESIWNVDVLNVATGEVLKDWCNVFINASGILKYVVP